MDEEERKRLIRVYGTCTVCAEPRKVKVVKTKTYTSHIMVCTKDDTHKQ